MNTNITKQGIIHASGNSINPNICTWGYSRNPLLPNTAGTTILSITDFGNYRRYTATTQGNDGGKYGYPCNNSLVQGTVYTWSCELRSNVPLTFSSNGRIGFEGGGICRGANVKIGTDWTFISNTWTQTTSQAFVFYPSGDLAQNSWIDIRNLKCEVGSVATPFTIPPSETTNYVGDNHGFFEDIYPMQIGEDYIKASNFIEI